MKNLYLFLNLLILNNLAFAQDAVVTLDMSGNYTLNPMTAHFFKYCYKKTGEPSCIVDNALTPAGNMDFKLNPFISWDFHVYPYDYLGQEMTPKPMVVYENNSSSNPKPVGYTYDFESSEINEGWRGYRLENTTSNTNSSITEEVNLPTMPTGNSLKMRWYYGGCMLVSPKLNNLSTDKKLTLDVFNTQYYGNSSFVIGTISDPYNPSTFHPLKNVTIDNQNALNEIQVFLNNLTPGDQYFAIKSNGIEGTIWIDNFTYEQSVNCFDITNIGISNVSEHNATISYSSTTANSYEISLKNLRTGVTKIYNTTNADSLEINDLVGATNYELKIRGNCAPELYTNWSTPLIFTTTCDGISEGYFSSFGDENNYIDPCWSSILNRSSIYSISEYNSTSPPILPKSGSKIVQISSSSMPDQKAYLISPYVSDLDNNKRIKFFLTSDIHDYNDREIYIGTMLNPNDESTFVPFETLTPDDVNQYLGYKVNYNLKEHIIYLDNYNTNLNHHYIAFKFGSTTNTFNSISFFIDDFKYESKPICKEPTDLKCLRNDVGNIILKWNDYDLNSNEWELEYGLRGFTLGSGTKISINSNPYTLTANLLEKEDYDFYVRTKCGNQYSNWSDVGSFKSKCSLVNVGYVADFENENFNTVYNNNTCWSRITPDIRKLYFNPNAYVRYMGNVTTETEYVTPVSGNSMMEIFDFADSENVDPLYNEKSILVSPRLNGLNSEKKITFFARASLNGYATKKIEVGTLTDIQDYTTFVPFETIDTELVYNQWKEYTVDFSSYRGTSEYVGIRVFGTNEVNLRVFFDDFKYLNNDCTKPSGLTAKQNGANSVELNWATNNSNQVNCEIEYGYPGFTPGAGTIVTTTSLPFTLNGLDANYEYEYRVRNICSNPTINWSKKYKFKIACAVNQPYEDNFDQYTATNYELIPEEICWSIHTDSNENTNQGVDEQSFDNYNSSPNVFYLNNFHSDTVKNLYLISPYLADFDNNKKIKFWINKGYDSQNLIIGTMSNPADTETFIPFQTITTEGLPAYGKEINIDFSTYIGNNKFIAIKLLPGEIYKANMVYIDDFKYLERTSCSEPINIRFLNISHNSTLIKWDDTLGSDVEIEYGNSGFTQGTGTIVNSNSNEFLVSGLQPQTSYDFYFKTKCSVTSQSIVIKKTISTSCPSSTIPWFENFQNISTFGINQMPNCMKVIEGELESINQPRLLNTSFYNPDHTLDGFSDSSYLYLYEKHPAILSPPLELTAGVTYRFSVDARKAYQYRPVSLRLYVGRGRNKHSMEFESQSIGQLSEYGYNTISFFYTPLETGVYTFILDESSDTTDANMILDNLSVYEGYDNVVNFASEVFNFQSGYNAKLIHEDSPSSKSSIITDVNNNTNKVLSMKGSTILNQWENSVSDIWLANQSNITKTNFKIYSVINTSRLTNFYMLFDLRQTFNESNNESMFRVVVNGNVMAIIKPITNNADPMQPYQIDLSPYLGNDINVSLQHIGKYSGNIGDNAYLDNIRFSTTSVLSTTENHFSEFSYFPNPTNDIVTLENKNTIDFIEVTSLTGQVVHSQENNTNRVLLDLTNYASGVYFLRVNSQGKNKTFKIVKN